MVVCALGVIAFASTNIDTLFVLLGFFADPRYRTRDVIIGQYLGIGLLYAVSVVASLLSLIAEPRYIALLGLVPIMIGARQLVKQMSGWERGKYSFHRQPHAHTAGRFGTVAAITIANGGDNLGVYIPLFAVHGAWSIGLMGGVFVFMTGLWCAVARWLAYHQIVGASIRRYAQHVMPLCLVGLGLSIIARSGA